MKLTYPAKPLSEEPITLNGAGLSPQDLNFKSELQYDGYKSIEEYDNDEYSAELAGMNDDPERELNFEERQETDLIEENVLDKQDNKKE